MPGERSAPPVPALLYPGSSSTYYPLHYAQLRILVSNCYRIVYQSANSRPIRCGVVSCM